MASEPRIAADYNNRQIEAARRVLVDIGQVLASFSEAIVVVGGWVPNLLYPTAEPKHGGSIDVDLALDAVKLTDGRYSELLRLLLNTGRYRPGDKPFQLTATVDLYDGRPSVSVDVDFLAPADFRMRRRHPKAIKGFRVLQVEACAAALAQPQAVELDGVGLGPAAAAAPAGERSGAHPRGSLPLRPTASHRT